MSIWWQLYWPYLAVGGGPLLTTLIGWWLRGWWDKSGREIEQARTETASKPIPYRLTPAGHHTAGPAETPAPAVTCRRCQGHTGLCTCLTDCGHAWCLGDRPTSMATLTPADIRWLRNQSRDNS